MHEIKQNAVADRQVDIVTINSFNFPDICSIIVAKLNASCRQNSTIVTYKIDTGIDGNIMPYHLFKSHFLGQQKSSGSNKTSKIIVLKTYNKAKIPQLGIYSIIFNLKKKQT